MRSSEKRWGRRARRSFQPLPNLCEAPRSHPLEEATQMGLTSHCVALACRIQFRLNDHELDHELRHASLAPTERCGESAESPCPNGAARRPLGSHCFARVPAPGRRSFRGLGGTRGQARRSRRPVLRQRPRMAHRRLCHQRRWRHRRSDLFQRVTRPHDLHPQALRRQSGFRRRQTAARKTSYRSRQSSGTRKHHRCRRGHGPSQRMPPLRHAA